MFAYAKRDSSSLPLGSHLGTFRRRSVRLRAQDVNHQINYGIFTFTKKGDFCVKLSPCFTAMADCKVDDFRSAIEWLN